MKAILTSVLFVLMGSSLWAVPADVTKALVDAQKQAQTDLAAGNGHASPYLSGTWTFMKRMCVSELSLDSINHPTQVFDISNYYGVFNFINTSERLTLSNADKLGTRCTAQVTGAYSSVPVNLQVNGVTIEEVAAVEMTERQKINCANSYTGPKLGQVFDVLKVDADTAYFFLLPGQLTNPVNCTNPNDFNVDLLVRVPNVTP